MFEIAGCIWKWLTSSSNQQAGTCMIGDSLSHTDRVPLLEIIELELYIRRTRSRCIYSALLYNLSYQYFYHFSIFVFAGFLSGYYKYALECASVWPRILAKIRSSVRQHFISNWYACIFFHGFYRIVSNILLLEVSGLELLVNIICIFYIFCLSSASEKIFFAFSYFIIQHILNKNRLQEKKGKIVEYLTVPQSMGNSKLL